MRNSNTLFGLACLLLVMTLLPGNPTHAQESKKNSPCISVETLETMLHLPISDVFDIMAEKDYQMGSITDTITDTVDNFPLRYMRTGFYHFSKSGNIEVLLMESLDGLSNYVQFSMKHKGECDFISDLLNHAYTLNSVKSVFVGTKPVKGRIERYECKVLQDQDTSLWVQLKNVDEITKYITPQKKAAVDRVKKAMARADVLRNAGKFAEAFSTLDSVMDYYPPMNDSIRITYQLVEKSRTIHYSALLDMALLQSEGESWVKALPLCDTILSLEPQNEKVLRVKELLEARKNNVVLPFRSKCPQSFEILCKQLQDVVNLEIRNHIGNKKQELRLDFNVRTDYENETSADVSVAMVDTRARGAKPSEARINSLRAEVDSIANSPLISPVREHNVYVRTADTISALVRWDYTTSEFDARLVKDSLMQSMIDSIEHQFMYEVRTSKTELEADGTFKQYRVPRLPTKRVYTFGWVNKDLERQGYVEQYRDIYLMDFQTARGLSWAPSLIIPGLATYQQGARSDVASRAIPFFLFGGLGVFGLLWETRIDHPVQELTDAAMNPFYLKNVGYYLSSVGFGIASIIYINELVEGISNSVKNAKRSKAIRRRLAEGPLMIDAQDVIIR